MQHANRNRRMIMAAAAVVYVGVVGSSGYAASVYWDTSNAVGLTAGASTWDVATTAAWAPTNNPGIAAPTTWTDGNTAVFATGGTNTVTVSGTVAPYLITSSSLTATTTTNISGGTIALNQTEPLLINGSNSVSIGSAITLTPASGYNRFRVYAGSLAISGNIGETSKATFRALGDQAIPSGTTTLSGTNTFTGGVLIDKASSLNITSLAALGLGVDTNAGILFGSSATMTADSTLNVDLATSASTNKSLMIRGGTGARMFLNSNGAGAATFTGSMLFSGAVGATSFNAAAGDVTVNLGGSSTANNTLQTAVVNASGYTTSLTKKDAGTWVLSGTNTYSGATSITGGKLVVTGSTANSAVSVGGGTLAGGGTTGAVTILSSGFLSPGNSIGTLNVASLDVSAVDGTGALQFELGSDGSSDMINASGALTLGSLDFSDFAFASAGTLADGNTYTLLHGASLSGALGDASGSLGGGFTGTLSLSGSDVLLAVGVPEPATVGLLGAVVSLGLLRRQRRVAR